MIRLSFTFFWIFIFTSPAAAQLYDTQYRAPGQNWMEINTEQFRLIYPERYHSEALQSLSILEREYEEIQNKVGGSLQNVPFIINPENDRSNGFVSPLNFRSEVELAPIRGKDLNPKSGDWLETVLPHELVHALHMSVNPRPSVTGLIGLLSKDFRRSIHSMAPLGLLEGIAVQHETHGTITEYGRGNYPYFYNRFNAVLGTDEEWSMGQLVHISDYSLPFNRHYIGGYEFTSWLLKTYGDEIMKEAIEYHFKYPVLGFGIALRRTTGKYPKTLYQEFSSQRKNEEQARLDQLPGHTQVATEIPFSAKCRQMQRPYWLDDETIIFYARSCNRPVGFYTWQTGSGQPELLKEVHITEDYQYNLSSERNELLYSRYHVSPLYDNLSRGDLHRLDISSGKTTRLTKNKRLFSPDFSGDEISALQTEAHQQKMVILDGATSEMIREIPKPDSSTVVQAAANPASAGQFVVIGKRKSVQALWFENIRQADSLFTRQPDIVFPGGSVFDSAWHPSGEKMLFVSDHTGTMNVYEYDLSAEQITQITNSRYNAFEASYSPDGENIAYVSQSENERRLYVMSLDESMNRIVPPEEWKPGPGVSDQFDRPLIHGESSEISGYTPRPYKTGVSWIRPRAWTPLYERQNGYDKFGLNLQSVDVLNSQAYSLEASHLAERFWFDFNYENKSFYPGFNVSLFNEPFLGFFTVQRDGEQAREFMLRQRRGASVSIPIRIRLESNARFSSLLFEPEYSVAQIRFLNPDSASETYSDFATRHTLRLWNVFSFGLRQFTRDIQPNRGMTIFTDSRIDLNRDEISGGDGDFTLAGRFTRRRGIRAGVTAYAAPLQKFNQSLRVTVQAVTQTEQPVFNTPSLFSDSFSGTPLAGATNTAILDTRYTIPLTYPDDGGLLIPVYLSNLYLVLFSQTAADLNEADLIEGSRSVFGGGIRSRFRVSNLGFDIGIMIGWEPMRKEVTYRFGVE
ncbi:MAG: hypothetical protein WD604_10765 [Balneolaceae bacterium]